MHVHYAFVTVKSTCNMKNDVTFSFPFFGIVPVTNLETEIWKSHNFPDMIKKKKSERFPVVCLAQLFSGLWFGSVWLCAKGCSGCVSAWQVWCHETQSMGVCPAVWAQQILCGLDDREEKWCSKRGSTREPVGIWHFLSLTSLFVGAAPFAARCWWRRVLRMWTKQAAAVGWAQFEQGAVFCPCVTAAATSKPPLPLPLPDILSRVVARNWAVLSPLCFLLCFMGNFCAPKMSKRDLRNDWDFGLWESTSSVLWSHRQSCPQPH